jgi:DNA mismatch endonuclease (patch repair protein)
MDVFSVRQRSRIMRAVRSRGTKPEIAVGRLLRSLKIRYRSHPVGLHGRPDFALCDSPIIIFVHGCFWHGHSVCGKARIPADNRSFWSKKLTANRRRDRKVVSTLRRRGFSVLTIWECELRSIELVAARLRRVIRRTVSRDGNSVL